MTIRFRLISEEDEAFLREIEIDSNCNFLELHNFIQENLQFEEGQMASFFLTDNNWEKDEEITLIDMKLDDSYSAHIMVDTLIKDFIQKPKQRLLYVFDFFNERNLFMEVYEIIDTPCSSPKCINSKGEAPQQLDIMGLFDEDTLDPGDNNNNAKGDENNISDDEYDFDSEFKDEFKDEFEDDPMISYTDNLEDL